MIDIVLETIRASILGGILGFLLWVGKNGDFYKQKGWSYIVVGSILVFLGSVIDITDNFSRLNAYVIVGDTPSQAFLEKVVGSLLGYILIFLGFWHWLPLVSSNKRQATESEQKYQSLMNQSPDFWFVSRTDDLQFTEVNDRACEHYGYSRDEIMSMNILNLEVEPPTQLEVRALYDKFPIGHVLEVYGTNKRKDGSTFPVHVRFSKLDETYAVANVRDISQQKMAEDENRRQAEENSTARLNAAVSLAREEELVDSRRRVMTMSEGLRRDIAYQLHGTVQNKLIVLQQTMGHLTEKLEVESIREEFSKLDMILTDLIQNDVRGISQQLYPSMLRRGLMPAMFSLISRMEPTLNVERQFAEDIQSREAAERDFIPLASRLAAYRITEDALTNVVKHSESNAVTIRLELQGEEQLRLTVRDEGVGFDSQSETASLGLSAMRDYAEVAGGKCEITSSPGRGTEVTALLPLRVES